MCERITKWAIHIGDRAKGCSPRIVWKTYENKMISKGSMLQGAIAHKNNANDIILWHTDHIKMHSCIMCMYTYM